MKDYERVCICCSWRFTPYGLERFCGPCGRTRGLPGYPLDAYGAALDKEWHDASGHDCRASIAEQEAARLNEANRQLARERRDRWPDVQREEYEDRLR